MGGGVFGLTPVATRLWGGITITYNRLTIIVFAVLVLAAALMELTKWWLEHPQRMTAAALDDHFHDMARRVLVPSRHISARS